ncbi:hypothetical protein D3C76_418380 [compost metagenome]
MPRRTRPKRLPRQHRHPIPLQQPLGEMLGGQPGLAHVDHHEHPAIRPNRTDTRTMPEARTHQVAALAILFAHRRHLRQVFIQRQLRGLLHELRNAEQHAQRQMLQMVIQGFWPDHPAHSPAGHGMGFGQAVDGRRTLGHARQAGRADVFALVQQIAVDLVADQPQVMPNTQQRQFLPDHQRQTGAGRIVRAVEQQRAGFGGNPGRHVRRIDPKTVLRTHRHRHHLRPTRTEHPFIGHVHRLGDYHFIARIEQALRDRIHRVLRPGHHDHMVGVHHLTASTSMSPGNAVAQGPTATR